MDERREPSVLRFTWNTLVGVGSEFDPAQPVYKQRAGAFDLDTPFPSRNTDGGISFSLQGAGPDGSRLSGELVLSSDDALKILLMVKKMSEAP